MESAEYWNQFRKVYLTISAKASDSDFSLYGMLCLAQRAFTCGWILYKLWRGIVGNKLQTNQIVATYRLQASAPVITSVVRHFHSASAVVFSRLHTSRVIYFFRSISPSPEFQQPSYPYKNLAFVLCKKNSRAFFLFSLMSISFFHTMETTNMCLFVANTDM